ncbi:MAG: acetate kinase [Deltaproteobacteria bacterium]|nr:acetate kinase [Deltaproteobacteria bacterium]
MKVLVINCGSSSFKYQLLDMEREALLCSGLVERIGADMSDLTHKKYLDADKSEKYQAKERFPTHTEALQAVVRLFTDPVWGVVKSIEEIGAVGHRVVHGGERFTQACVIDQEVYEGIMALSPMAPLHNPANLQGYAVARQVLPHAPSVAVFDTEFHSSLPPSAFRYGLPNYLYEEDGIRRYGFHGTSHKYVSRKAAEFMGRKPEELNLITCHLGNGSSLAAVRGGQCVDTTMGFTPLPGLLMGTRCGDLDPAINYYLSVNRGMSPKEIDTLMNKQSGFMGLCGMSDLRDIHEARKNGDQKAQLAFEVFCHMMKRQVGALWAVLGRVDALVFTAGIGENDQYSRAGGLAGLEDWGLKIDPALNEVRSGDPRYINAADSRVKVLVVPTNEELEIARTTKDVLQAKR